MIFSIKMRVYGEHHFEIAQIFTLLEAFHGNSNIGFKSSLHRLAYFYSLYVLALMELYL